MVEGGAGDEDCASRLKALADPVRLKIVKALQAGEMTVSDLAELLETEVANASHHCRALKNQGLAITRRDGKYIYYALDPRVHSRKARSGESCFDLGCCRFVLPSDEAAGA